MPRYSRKRASTNVYHIILRGINQQDIFLEKADYQKFLKELKETKEKYKYEIYAYVLMTNHVHLLIHDKEDVLSSALQSLGIRYSQYFNKKYQRCGHLFQNRFLSKSVENTSYLLNLQRYIHQNPVKEKIAKIEEYQWSSYQEYLKKHKIADTQFILSLFSQNEGKAIQLFQNFNNTFIEENIFEYELKLYLTDDEVIQLMKEILQEENLMQIQNYNKEIRNKMLEKVLKIQGTTAVQIARILGLNKRMVQRVAKNNMCPKNDKVSLRDVSENDKMSL